MLVVWSAVIGVLVFFVMVIVTLLFGAAANAREKEAWKKTLRERRAGLDGDVTSDKPHPIHQPYLDA